MPVRGRVERRIWPAAPGQYGPPRYRRACEYDSFVPAPVAGAGIGLTGEAAAAVSTAERAIARLNARSRPELLPLARLLLRTESIASSKVEGLQVGIRSLARAEADPGRRAGGDAGEVLANVAAMLEALERATISASIRMDDLLSIHRILLEASPNPSIAGRLRRSQNWIGGNDYNPCGADFVPPPPEEVEELLADLCSFVDDDSLPPLVQAAIAHAQFETIHPFDDGNGRTGRALVHVILRRRGLAPAFVPPISVVFADRKDAYVRGLILYREDRVGEWIETFASAATRAAELAERYTITVQDLQDEWRRRLNETSKPRRGAAVWSIVDALPAHPVLTAADGVAITGRTSPAVRNAIKELVTANVLAPTSTAARNRAWEATELLDLMEDLEAGQLP